SLNGTGGKNVSYIVGKASNSSGCVVCRRSRNSGGAGYVGVGGGSSDPTVAMAGIFRTSRPGHQRPQDPGLLIGDFLKASMILMNNPEDPVPKWPRFVFLIGFEEVAGKIKKARELIKRRYEECPMYEDVWLEAWSSNFGCKLQNLNTMTQLKSWYRGKLLKVFKIQYGCGKRLLNLLMKKMQKVSLGRAVELYAFFCGLLCL
nr:protein stabilized1 [Tanacetum cinerariifolium]